MRPARAQSPPAAADAAGQIGQVATIQGSATATRAKATTPVALRVADPIFKNDTLATGANSTLGVTFDDESTFNLSADSRIVVDEFVYESGGQKNAASVTVATGTAAFVAGLVAKTGDMKIKTPVATMGIRGTTGVIDVPQAGAAGAGEPRVKLYADSDGHVGRIEVFGLQGATVGSLTLAASAFTLRLGAGGRLEAVPYPIPPEEAARDRGVLRRLFASHSIGRRMTRDRQRSRSQHREQNKRPSGHGPSGHNGGRPRRQR